MPDGVIMYWYGWGQNNLSDWVCELSSSPDYGHPRNTITFNTNSFIMNGQGNRPSDWNANVYTVNFPHNFALEGNLNCHVRYKWQSSNGNNGANAVHMKIVGGGASVIIGQFGWEGSEGNITDFGTIIDNNCELQDVMENVTLDYDCMVAHNNTQSCEVYYLYVD